MPNTARKKRLFYFPSLYLALPKPTLLFSRVIAYFNPKAFSLQELFSVERRLSPKVNHREPVQGSGSWFHGYPVSTLQEATGISNKHFNDNPIGLVCFLGILKRQPFIGVIHP